MSTKAKLSALKIVDGEWLAVEAANTLAAVRGICYLLG